MEYPGGRRRIPQLRCHEVAWGGGHEDERGVKVPEAGSGRGGGTGVTVRPPFWRRAPASPWGADPPLLLWSGACGGRTEITCGVTADVTREHTASNYEKHE